MFVKIYIISSSNKRFLSNGRLLISCQLGTGGALRTHTKSTTLVSEVSKIYADKFLRKFVLVSLNFTVGFHSDHVRYKEV